MFEKAIADALTDEYIGKIPRTEEHVFSDEFEKKMQKLIRFRKQPFYSFMNTTGKRIAVVVTVILVAGMTTVLSVDALREKFFGFFIERFEKYSVIQPAEISSAPDHIEEIYAITSGIEDYDVTYEENTEILHNTMYGKDNIVVDFSQCVKSEYKQYWNTEGAVTEKTQINGYDAIIFTDNHKYNHIIWETDDYIFSISTNLPKNELLNIAKSVEKVE